MEEAGAAEEEDSILLYHIVADSHYVVHRVDHSSHTILRRQTLTRYEGYSYIPTDAVQMIVHWNPLSVNPMRMLQWVQVFALMMKEK